MVATNGDGKVAVIVEEYRKIKPAQCKVPWPLVVEQNLVIKAVLPAAGFYADGRYACLQMTAMRWLVDA